MKQKYEKFLPIGSVILLKKGQKKLMIVGYTQIYLKNKSEIYDYMGCVYPEGMINIKNFYFFNHEDIEEVFYVGYQDEEEKEFMQKLISSFEKIKKNI